MPQQDLNLIAAQPEPFLASLYDDGTGHTFAKPREKCMSMSGQYKNNYMSDPGYQNMPLYIPPPDYGIPAPVSPTPSPSPYNEHDNDPLCSVKKFHNQIYPDQYGMYDPNKPDELSKILQKDIALTHALHMDDGFNLNMAQIDDQNLSSLDYMTPTTDTAPGLQYRSPSDYYTLNDVANLCGIPSDTSSLYPQQLNNSMYQNYEGYSVQYPSSNMVDLSEDKKLSPIEQAYQASWGQTADPNLFDKINPYGLVGKEDYNLAAFSLADQQLLHDNPGSQQQMRGSFPAMDIQPETSIPNLRGRKNSSFREWNPSTDNVNKDTRLPTSMAGQIEGQFNDHKMNSQMELLNEGSQMMTPTCGVPPEQMVPEYHDLTPLTAGPGLTPTLQQPSPSDPETLDKVRSVFMSFVDQSDEHINNMDDAAKHQMFVDVCNMYKSLSVINIAENLYQGKKGEGGCVQPQSGGEDPANVVQQRGEARLVNKRYKFRPRSENKTESPRISPSTSDPIARVNKRNCSRTHSVIGEADDLKGKGNNVCNFCGKAFPSNSSLKVHMNLHTGEKPHICQFCNRGFGDPSNLKRHLRIHTRSRPYTCHMCPTSFNQSSHLVRHIRSHSQRGCQKSCRFCLATFPHYSNLRRHTEKCAERKKRGDVPLLPEDDDDLKDDEFYEDQLNEQTFSQENSGSHHLTNKHDMNFVLGGQGIEGEPFIDLSPIDISGQCDETYMRLTSMKQERSKVMSGQHSVIFGMKAGDGSDISV
ncbi:hypothetical protein ACHWQZ_G012155 [Mnemiopsis leidyi]